MPLAMGVHSGTSMDAIAVAVIDVEESEEDDIELLDSAEYPYSDEAQQDLQDLVSKSEVTLREVSRTNAVIGDEFADAAKSFVDESGLSFDDIDVIGTYGQTIGHYPGDSPSSTLQLGEGVRIAEETGVDTVSNFFTRDLVAGGVGAPLIMRFDHAHYADPDEDRLVLNIGGISNVTYLPAESSIDDVRAFDTGPGNMLIDAAVRKQTDGKEILDEDGERASRGDVADELLAELMGHPFVNAAPPKSSGRADFGDAELQDIWNRAAEHNVSGDDLVATLTAFTAEAIAYNKQKFIDEPVDRTIVFGGGSRNPAIVDELTERMEGEIVVSDELGHPHDAREVMGTAYIGYRSWSGKQTNVPSATGSQPVCGGAVARGDIKDEPSCEGDCW